MARLHDLAHAVGRVARGVGSQGDQAAAADATARRLAERHTNQVWFAEFDQCLIVIKVFAGQQDDGPDREWNALGHFAAVTPEQVPEPLFVDRAAGIVAMTHVAGDPLADRELTSDQVDALASWLTIASAARPRIEFPVARTAPIALVPRTRNAWDRVASYAIEDPIVRRAVDNARAWLSTSELDTLLALPTRVVSRGDSNLANCLWDGARLSMIDFEDAGWNHAAVQLGDYMEHIRAHRVPETSWMQLLDLTESDRVFRTHVLTVRRRFAMFWLLHLLPGGRAADRNPPGAARRQAERVLRLLDSE